MDGIKPFDIEAGYFTATELAERSGLSRAMVDVWSSEGRFPPTRREHSPRRSKGRARKGRGRPLYSAIKIFEVRVACEIARSLNIGLSEWLASADQIRQSISDSPLILPFLDAAERTTEGNWMWAVARAIESGKHLNVYGYAAFRKKGGWLFDMHVGQATGQLARPRFGTDLPHVYIPASEIFADVYVKCKELLTGDEREP